tara:strand:+ start:29497 stop:30579 length:1083 start_codon:yes stop_codon:yes gene_type:complete
MNSIEITQPDDWHLHVRDGRLLDAVIADSANFYKRALIMPNLNPPVRTVLDALNYRKRILLSLEKIGLPLKKSNKHFGSPLYSFEPYMSIYLTESLHKEEIKKISRTNEILAVKFYPTGATTNSEFGLKNLSGSYDIFELMSELGIVLCIHGEVVDPDVDVFDREAVFIDRILTQLLKRFPKLKIVFEHISTAAAVQFVLSQKNNVAATITPQHLIFNRNDLLAGSIKPHRYCAPILKEESDRLSLVQAATSGDSRFFLGTDSAPHLVSEKESDCGCAGCYSAPHSLYIYTEVFDSEGKLENLEGFASINGPSFYKLSPNKNKIRLVRKKWIPSDDADIITIEGEKIVSVAKNRELNWSC